MFGQIGWPEALLLLLIILLSLVLSVLPFWKICSKAGYSKWLSLVSVIPYAGILLLLFYLAFAEWPIQRRLNSLYESAGGRGA